MIIPGIVGSYFLTMNKAINENEINTSSGDFESILAKADSSNQYIYVVGKDKFTEDCSLNSLNKFTAQNQCFMNQNVNKNPVIFCFKNPGIDYFDRKNLSINIIYYS